jgi:hypothetical protein
MQKEVAPGRIARLKRSVPKGMIKVIELPPIKGDRLQPISAKELGLGERSAA